jgi:hypothetical protein
MSQDKRAQPLTKADPANGGSIQLAPTLVHNRFEARAVTGPAHETRFSPPVRIRSVLNIPVISFAAAAVFRQAAGSWTPTTRTNGGAVRVEA